ncbi:uncharacterized protein LOC126795569 [Argentina anserina]|uniref:uncharacterized protein LOC126795569 n=1 Tax=Argentina anserina TaxID=57926 RepID=UPI0021767D44|nr:uncharacterized protein LOC126795569 [Potentilla anserina]
MGTEILRPHDCLIERIRSNRSTTLFSQPVSYKYYANGPIHLQNHRYRNSAVRAEQKRLESATLVSKRIGRSNYDALMKAKNVIILRRGEPLNRMKKATSDNQLERFGQGRTMVPKKAGIVDLKYAGSAFAMSPEPSSLPLPSFSRKKKHVSRSFDDSATINLRRLLRLE